MLRKYFISRKNRRNHLNLLDFKYIDSTHSYVPLHGTTNNIFNITPKIGKIVRYVELVVSCHKDIVKLPHINIVGVFLRPTGQELAISEK